MLIKTCFFLLTDHGHGQGDEEDEYVAPDRVVVGPMALAKDANERVQFVLCQGL